MAGRLPRSEAERAEHARVIGEDGHALLAALAPAAPDWQRAVLAVETLRRIRVQRFYLRGEDVHWRSAKEGIPPAARFIGSPHDLDAHHARKSTTCWVGYEQASGTAGESHFGTETTRSALMKLGLPDGSRGKYPAYRHQAFTIEAW